MLLADRPSRHALLLLTVGCPVGPDQGLDTVAANDRLGFKVEQRDDGIGTQIPSDLGVKTKRLLTNNAREFVGLQGYGLSVSEAVPLEIPASEHTRKYLRT